jgi:hypothetical protein
MDLMVGSDTLGWGRPRWSSVWLAVRVCRSCSEWRRKRGKRWLRGSCGSYGWFGPRRITVRSLVEAPVTPAGSYSILVLRSHLRFSSPDHYATSLAQSHALPLHNWLRAPSSVATSTLQHLPFSAVLPCSSLRHHRRGWSHSRGRCLCMRTEGPHGWRADGRLCIGHTAEGRCWWGGLLERGLRPLIMYRCRLLSFSRSRTWEKRAISSRHNRMQPEDLAPNLVEQVSDAPLHLDPPLV